MELKNLILMVIFIFAALNVIVVKLEDNGDMWESLDYEDQALNETTDKVAHSVPTSWAYRFGVPKRRLQREGKVVGQSTDDVFKFCSNGLWNTCVGRCGTIPRSVPYTCSCDSLCHLYDDCCSDYGSECGRHIGSSSTSHRNVSLEQTFSCIRIDTESHNGALMVSKCPTWWSKHIQYEEKRLQCENRSSVVPVTSKSSNLVFRNVHCAICNGLSDVIEWTLHRKCSSNDSGIDSEEHLMTDDDHPCPVTGFLPPTFLESSLRSCSYNIGTCSETFSTPSDVDKCSSYNEPIFSEHNGVSEIYKNVYCAFCNGITIEELYCPAWDVLMTSEPSNAAGFSKIVPVFGNVELTTDYDAMTRVRSRVGDDVPAAFTILFSFGTDGNMRTMFDSQDNEIWALTKANCQDLEIWDPFTNMCRRIYCSSEFVLVNFQCVKIYDNSTVSRGEPVDNSSFIDALLKSDMSTVEMSLFIRLNKPLSKSVTETLKQNFIPTLANSVDASSDRFANFTLVTNDTANNVSFYAASKREMEVVQGAKTQVTFRLSESHNKTNGEKLSKEPSIEKIVSSLSTGISLSQYYLHIENNITVHLTGISEKMVASLNDSLMLDWCYDGRKLYYENNDIEAVFVETNDSSGLSMTVHVIATNVTYYPGQYLASVVFQGSHQQREANFSGYVIVCHEVAESNCTRVAIPPSDYELLPNASLLYLGNESFASIIDEDSYEILPDGTALICYDLIPKKPTNQHDDDYDSYSSQQQSQEMCNLVLTSISLLASLLTIVTYASFSSLRNMPGIYVLNLTACLWLFQFLFLISERRSVSTYHPIECQIASIVVHYFALCYFFWMNVIAYDIHRTFSSGTKILTATTDRGRTSTRVRISYGLFFYAYGCPAFIVCTCTLLNYFRFADISIDYGTNGLCWIGDKTALLVSFVLIIGLILLTNAVFYVRTVLFISRIHKETKLTIGQQRSKHVGRHSIVYLRIGTILGFTWLLGFFITTPLFKSVVLNVILDYLFIIANASPGTLIFIVFVCNAKVLNLYRQSCCFRSLFVRKKCPDCDKVICICQKPVIRTVSNETTRSVVSSDVVDSQQQQTTHTKYVITTSSS